VVAQCSDRVWVVMLPLMFSACCPYVWVYPYCLSILGKSLRCGGVRLLLSGDMITSGDNQVAPYGVFC
jgi:hypothetical protein